MNPILALAIAIGTSSPLLERDLDLLHKPAKPISQVDLDRMAAAQAKRERKASKRSLDAFMSEFGKRWSLRLKTTRCACDACTSARMLDAVRKAPPDARVTELDGKALFFSVDAEQEWVDSRYELTDAEEAEAQALSDHDGDAMALACKFAGVQS